MRIFKKVIVILIMILSMLSVKSFASTGTINIEATRLRKENNTTSEILTNIYEDEEVEIVEEHGEWIKIKYKEYTGFIKKEYVTIKEELKKENVSNYENSAEILENANETTVLSTTSIRLLPSFMSKKIQEISQETKVTVISQINNWAQITDGSITGWIVKSKLNLGLANELVKPSDLETTTPSQNKENTTTDKINTVTNTVKENTISNTTTTNQSTMTTVSKTGKVNVETANVREEPSTSAKRIDFLDEGDVVTITEEIDEWYKVEHGDIKGYVSKKLITITSENGQVSSRGTSEERRNEINLEENKEEIVEKQTSAKNESNQEEVKSASGDEVVEYAKKYLGYSYVVGGKTPETGFDCSGFTRYVYKNFGYNLASISYEQTSVGTEVTRENLKPGDLILFYNDEKTKIGHTGVYVGNGKFIHAANPKRGVVCDDMNTLSYYNERFVTARRIVE